MKVLAICLALVIVMAGGVVFADNADTSHWYQETSGASYDNPIFNQWLNHTHSTYIEQRRNPVGVGLDLVVYEGEGLLEAGTVETKYDWQNDEGSVFVVGKINLYKSIKVLLNK